MNYPNAPIREAVFDIRVDKLNIGDVSDLLKIKDNLIEEFPIEKKSHQITGMFQVSEDKPIESKTHSDLTGFVFISKDGTRQIQIRVDGFTLNILKPYGNWESHFECFIKYWEIYNAMFNPKNITRIATRFINRIEIPLPLSKFQDYILNMPPIPSCLPQEYANFFMQIHVPCSDGIRSAIITETIEPIQANLLPFILDINVSQNLNLDKTKENLTRNFQEIRVIKNQIFESCITENTRNLFSL